MDGLRRAGHQDEIPRGLLARAALHRVAGDTGAARRDLDEAMEIAGRGPMRLYQTDAHLEYARLDLDLGEVEAARTHVDEAAALIEETGYHRRDDELADLKARLDG